MSDTSIHFKDEGYTSPDFLTNVITLRYSSSRSLYILRLVCLPLNLTLILSEKFTHQPNKTVFLNLVMKKRAPVHSNSKIIHQIQSNLSNLHPPSTNKKFQIQNTKSFSRLFFMGL